MARRRYKKKVRHAPKGNMAFVIGYVRVSKEDQRLSPDAQEKALKDWAKKEGKTLLEIHRDLGKSGELKPEDRPGLLSALEAVERTGSGALLVVKRDRLARQVIEAGLVERLLSRIGAVVLSVAGEGSSESTEDDDPSAALMRMITDAFSHYERLIIKFRTRKALAVKRARGERVGAIPFGWALGPDGKALVPDPREQATIKNAVAWHARGFTLREIGRLLVDNGFYPRIPHHPWQATQVARMLQRDDLQQEAAALAARSPALT